MLAMDIFFDFKQLHSADSLEPVVICEVPVRAKAVCHLTAGLVWFQQSDQVLHLWCVFQLTAYWFLGWTGPVQDESAGAETELCESARYIHTHTRARTHTHTHFCMASCVVLYALFLYSFTYLPAIFSCSFIVNLFHLFVCSIVVFYLIHCFILVNVLVFYLFIETFISSFVPYLHLH